VLTDVLWVRSQAVFESDGRKFAYVRNGDSFAPKNVTLVRRSASQAVIEGLEEGQEVALASPETAIKKQKGRIGGASEAIPR
jgi:HlyD family secretion protein